MSIIRTVELNTGNAERIISAVLKEEKERKLEFAKIFGKCCALSFSEHSVPKQKKTIVKQYAKEKYKSCKEAKEQFISKKENCYYFWGCLCPAWEQIEVIELSNSWLIFYRKIFWDGQIIATLLQGIVGGWFIY